MNFFSITSGPVETNGYILGDEDSRQCLIVDAPMDSFGPYTKHIKEKGFTVQAIVLTHSHWDHIADCAILQRTFNAPILIHHEDEYRILAPNEHKGLNFPFTFEAAKAQGYLNHGDVLECGAWNFEIRHTPGHTEGSICLIDLSHNIAIVGDVLFRGSIGRTDLPGGDHYVLLRSIRDELLNLPNDVQVLSGHGDPTTIGEERKSNPFLLDLSPK